MNRTDRLAFLAALVALAVGYHVVGPLMIWAIGAVGMGWW